MSERRYNFSYVHLFLSFAFIVVVSVLFVFLSVFFSFVRIIFFKCTCFHCFAKFCTERTLAFLSYFFVLCVRVEMHLYFVFDIRFMNIGCHMRYVWLYSIVVAVTVADIMFRVFFWGYVCSWFYCHNCNVITVIELSAQESSDKERERER